MPTLRCTIGDMGRVARSTTGCGCTATAAEQGVVSYCGEPSMSYFGPGWLLVQFPRLKLAPPATQPVCHETISTLKKLLAMAQSGRCVGFCYSACLPNNNYQVGTTGRFAESPTYARGAIAAIEDELREMVHGQANRAPEVSL